MNEEGGSIYLLKSFRVAFSFIKFALLAIINPVAY